MIGLLGFLSMKYFVWNLTIGYLYEWKKAALDWESPIDFWAKKRKGKKIVFMLLQALAFLTLLCQKEHDEPHSMTGT